MVEVEDLMIFKLREKGKGTVEEVAAPAQPAQAAKPKSGFLGLFGKKAKEQAAPSPAEQVVAKAPEIEEPAAGPYGVNTMEQEAPAGTGLEVVKGKFCEWHPWRPAYAVCNYCHRPFCYEDIVEVGKNYYCLEDIDKVSETYHEEINTKYNSIGFLSAGMFLLAFAVFIYFASGQLVYLAEQAILVGLPSFVSTLNYSYAVAIIGLVVTTFGLITAVLIFMQSRRGFVIGFITGLSNIALFSYQFLNSNTFYMALISLMAFAAVILLAYSKVSYYEVPEQSPYYNASRQMGWSNPGRF